MAKLELKEANFTKLDSGMAKMGPNVAYLGSKEADMESSVVIMAS